MRQQLVNWCFEPSQPLGITSGLKETFINRYIVKRTNKAEMRPEEQSEKTESCRENLWNEIQLKGPQRHKIDTKTEWKRSEKYCPLLVLRRELHSGPAGRESRRWERSYPHFVCWLKERVLQKARSRGGIGLTSPITAGGKPTDQWRFQTFWPHGGFFPGGKFSRSSRPCEIRRVLIANTLMCKPSHSRVHKSLSIIIFISSPNHLQ